jgi:protein phosphatase
MLDVQFGQVSDFGKVRKNNEDAMGSFIPTSRRQARSHGFLFAVCDGVGGMDFGEVASATAVKTLTEEFPKAQAGTMLTTLLPRLIETANSAVHDCSLKPEYQGRKMATTLVCCALRYNQAVVSHVGDSRCYLVRNKVARQITQDHTWVNEQRKMGLISASEMATSDARHVILRSLGKEMFVAPDTTALTLLAGDVLILCTDGLHDEIDEKEMDRLARQEDRRDCPRVGGPRRRGGRQRQHHRAGHPRALGRAGGDVPRAALPDARLRLFLARINKNSYGTLTLFAPFPDTVESISTMECAARWVFTTASRPVPRSITTALKSRSPAAAWPPSTAPPTRATTARWR